MQPLLLPQQQPHQQHQQHHQEQQACAMASPPQQQQHGGAPLPPPPLAHRHEQLPAPHDWNPQSMMWDPYRLLAVPAALGGGDAALLAAAVAAAGTTPASLVPPVLPGRAEPAGAAARANKATCKVQGCGRLLRDEKPYYQRFLVCEAHMRCLSIEVDGRLSRFCQQCGRFEAVEAFDGTKRSCRARLQEHNKRRRKVGSSNRGVRKQRRNAAAASKACRDAAHAAGSADAPGVPAAAAGAAASTPPQLLLHARTSAALDAEAASGGVRSCSTQALTPTGGWQPAGDRSSAPPQKQSSSTSVANTVGVVAGSPLFSSTSHDAAPPAAAAPHPPLPAMYTERDQQLLEQLLAESVGLLQDLQQPAAAPGLLPLPGDAGAACPVVEQPARPLPSVQVPAAALAASLVQLDDSAEDHRYSLAGCSARSSDSTGSKRASKGGRRSLAHGGLPAHHRREAAALQLVEQQLQHHELLQLQQRHAAAHPPAAAAQAQLSQEQLLDLQLQQLLMQASMEDAACGGAAGQSVGAAPPAFQPWGAPGLQLPSCSAPAAVPQLLVGQHMQQRAGQQQQALDGSLALARGGGADAAYAGVDASLSLSLKLHDASPGQLQRDMLPRLGALLGGGAGALPAGAVECGYVRPGCVQLLLQLRVPGDPDAAAEALAAAAGSATAEQWRSALLAPPGRDGAQKPLSLTVQGAAAGVMLHFRDGELQQADAGGSDGGSDGGPSAPEWLPSRPRLRAVLPCCVASSHAALADGSCSLAVFGEGLPSSSADAPGSEVLARCQGMFLPARCAPPTATQAALSARIGGGGGGACVHVAGLQPCGLVQLELLSEGLLLSAPKPLLVVEEPAVAAELQGLQPAILAGGRRQAQAERVLRDLGRLLDFKAAALRHAGCVDASESGASSEDDEAEAEPDEALAASGLLQHAAAGDAAPQQQAAGATCCDSEPGTGRRGLIGWLSSSSRCSFGALRRSFSSCLSPEDASGVGDADSAPDQRLQRRRAAAEQLWQELDAEQARRDGAATAPALPEPAGSGAAQRATDSDQAGGSAAIVGDAHDGDGDSVMSVLAAGQAAAVAARPPRRHTQHPLLTPEYRALMLDVGASLLCFLVDRGWHAAARLVLTTLLEHAAPAVSFPAVAAAVAAARGECLGLLHRAVRSGSLRMVTEVLGWGAQHRTHLAWDARGPRGVTPLHLLALAGSGAGAGGAAGGAPSPAGSLAAQLLPTSPPLWGLWFAVKDDAGMTPALYSSQLGAGALNQLASGQLMAQRAEHRRRQQAQQHPQVQQGAPGSAALPPPAVAASLPAARLLAIARAADTAAQGPGSPPQPPLHLQAAAVGVAAAAGSSAACRPDGSSDAACSADRRQAQQQPNVPPHAAQTAAAAWLLAAFQRCVEASPLARQAQLLWQPLPQPHSRWLLAFADAAWERRYTQVLAESRLQADAGLFVALKAAVTLLPLLVCGSCHSAWAQQLQAVTGQQWSSAHQLALAAASALPLAAAMARPRGYPALRDGALAGAQTLLLAALSAPMLALGGSGAAPLGPRLLHGCVAALLLLLCRQRVCWAAWQALADALLGALLLRRNAAAGPWSAVPLLLLPLAALVLLHAREKADRRALLQAGGPASAPLSDAAAAAPPPRSKGFPAQ